MNQKPDTLDIILRDYPVMPTCGWTAASGHDALAVLAQLALHLRRNCDHEGSQLLGRLWRFNSPVLAHLATMDSPNMELARVAQTRRMKVQQTINDAGSLMDLQVGDDVAEKLVPFMREQMGEAQLLADLVDLIAGGKENNTPRLEIDTTPGMTTVHVSQEIGNGRTKPVAYSANTVRGALRLAVDGEKERTNG